MLGTGVKRDIDLVPKRNERRAMKLLWDHGDHVPTSPAAPGSARGASAAEGGWFPGGSGYL